jgi:hypothetical protein
MYRNYRFKVFSGDDITLYSFTAAFIAIERHRAIEVKRC